MTDFQKQIRAERKKQQIGNPSCKNRFEHSAPTERDSNRVSSPIEKAYHKSLANTDRHPPSSGSGPAQAQGDADDGHHHTDEREGNPSVIIGQQSSDLISVFFEALDA